MKERKANYRLSLNLPRTLFPMRANLTESEKLSRQRWKETDLFARLMERRTGEPAFRLQEIPSSASFSTSLTEAVNKVLKDLVVRSRNMKGERCQFVPCWNGYGGQVEHKVLSELLDSGWLRELGQLEPDVRWREIRLANYLRGITLSSLQAERIQRLSTLGDYDKPILTMAASYECSVLEIFADLVAQGMVWRSAEPLFWSIANETVMRETEIEYSERRKSSVYLGFEASNPAALAALFGTEAANVSFLISSTNPWTLPANQLIAVNAGKEYSLVRLAGHCYVMASQLIPQVSALAGNSSAEELGRTRGAALLGLAYHQSLFERQGRVVAGDYPEEGTGIFSIAPGHGVADFAIGQREGLPIYSPVGADGRYDDTVPEWLRGELIWEADSKIVRRLEASGHLYYHQVVRQVEPRHWQSKEPAMVRCLDQWSLRIDRPTLGDGKSWRQRVLDAAENEMAVLPGWGKQRLREVLEQRRDWRISRQGSWGLPIPAFHREGGPPLLTATSVRAVSKVFATLGSEAWFRLSPEELLARYDPSTDPDLDDGAALDKSGLKKMFDSFGDWFTTSASWRAAMDRGLGFPADLFLEGATEYRGLIQLMMISAMGATGRLPFRTLLTYGPVNDTNGRKLIRHTRDPTGFEEILERYGADVVRWWVSSLSFQKDIKFNTHLLDVAGEAYRKVRNTLRFLLSNLYDFDESQAVKHFSPTSLDAWALGRAAQLREKVLEAYFSYQFRTANLLLFDFCNDDLSAIYLDATKDRLYCDRPDSARRRSTQTAMRQIADLLIHLLAPILPHTADEAHRALRGEAAESVHLDRYPELAPPQLDRHWDTLLALRAAARKALEEAKSSGIENPLDAGLVLPDPEGVIAAYRSELPEIFGVSTFHLETPKARSRYGTSEPSPAADAAGSATKPSG